jgi:hypothetical protein
MTMQARSSRFRRIARGWQPLIILVIGALWTVANAGITAYWAYYQYNTKRIDDRNENEKSRLAAEKDAAATRKIESQKPFLQRKLDIYFESIKVAEQLIDTPLDPNSEQWKTNAHRFWQLRWGELEMVGDAAIRQAARRVGEQIIEVEYDPSRNRHDLRWMVECLGDELRLSLEHAWGYDPMAFRLTATEEPQSKLPNGCSAGKSRPALFAGMLPLRAPGNSKNPLLDSQTNITGLPNNE